MKITTRFAPSPTGFLHIGGARTALFNYLYTKHIGGKFLLRIEDTDQKRSTTEAVDAIINGLKWLGILWDDNIVMQSNNINKHVEVANKLLLTNKAYHCYCPPKKDLDLAAANVKCNCVNLTIPPSSNIAPSVRLLVNKAGSTIVSDLVMGEIEVKNSEIDDFIILRSDQTPTYLLAVVVDDINMEITHVIRGDDHLTNTFRQIQIYKALNLSIPQYAHIPLIYGEDGTKMSKRHGALGASEYEDLGYLPEAICNYLLKLGWSHNDDEIISKSDAIKWFKIEDVNKSPARFDFAKLNSINSHYIKQLSIKELYTLLEPFIIKHIVASDLCSNYQNNFIKLLPFLQERFKTLIDIVKNGAFIAVDNVTIAEEFLTSLINNKAILTEQLELLTATVNFSRNELHDALKTHAEKSGLGLGKAVEGLRIALVGTKISPASVFDILEILGKETSIKRINYALSVI